MKRAVVAVDQAVGKFSKNTHHWSQMGWAIFLENGKQWDLDSYGEVNPDTPHYQQVRTWLKDTIGTLQAQGYDVHVPVETVYVGPNKNVAVRLAHIQGYLHGLVIDMGAEYAEIHPQTSQAVMTGIKVRIKSEERKAKMVAAATVILGEEPSTHIADALGIGKAYINQLGNGARP